MVGFGLSTEEGQQVACLAENTGGRYFPAQDAESLDEALNDTVTELAEAEPAEPDPEPAELPEASVSGPETVEIGRSFTVVWDGPGEYRDRIVLFDPSFDRGAGDGEGREVTGRRLRNGDMDKREVRLIAPVRPGSYQLQYRYGARRLVLGTAEIEVVDAAVSLDAPATVDIGREFTVTWAGPGGRYDRIRLIDTLAKDGRSEVVTGKLLRNDDFDGKRVKLIAPAKPGFYRLQYWNRDNRAELATRQIEVLEAEVGITAPDSVAMGTRFRAGWVGPGGRYDSVRLVDPAGDDGDGKVISNQRILGGDYDNKTVTLTAPAKPGDYLLQYYNRGNRSVLATTPLKVEAMTVSLEAPDAVTMGHVVRVKWSGPGGARDRIEIWDAEAKAGRGEVVKSGRIASGDMDKRLVELVAPVKPGGYVLRYWNADSRTVLAEAPLTVEAMEVGLSAPDATEAGTVIEVVWQGPGAARDRIQIADPKTGKVPVSKRIASGDYDNRKVTLNAPKPGAYVLRYWSADSKTVLAERPLTVD